MRKYKLEYTKIFLKQLKKFEDNVKNRILETIEEILENPHKGSFLVYSDEKCLKWRIGSYRIIYKLDEEKKIVILLVIAHRKKIYKRYKL